MSRKRGNYRFYTKVVGVTYNNDDGSSRQAIITHCRPGEPLALVPDPTNKYDKRAIKVCRQNGWQIGHLGREVAYSLSENLQAGRTAWARVMNITGGGHGQSYGMNIEVFVGHRGGVFAAIWELIRVLFVLFMIGVLGLVVWQCAGLAGKGEPQKQPHKRTPARGTDPETAAADVEIGELVDVGELLVWSQP